MQERSAGARFRRLAILSLMARYAGPSVEVGSSASGLISCSESMCLRLSSARREEMPVPALSQQPWTVAVDSIGKMRV